MRLFYNQQDKIFFCQCMYEEKDIPKSAGFMWEPIIKRWQTKDIRKAIKLIDFAQGYALETINKEIEQINKAIQMSRQTDADLDIPKPEGLEYLPFQKAGIAYAVGRQNTLIADDMGLGKTIQAIGYINYTQDIEKILVICPATLKLNWAREMRKWLVRELTIEIADSKYFPKSDIVIINYDIVKKFRNEIDSYKWDLMICDESHALKNPDTMRTIAVLGRVDNRKSPVKGIDAKRKLFLTGTPILNKPIELWPMLNALKVSFAKSFWDFAKKYCGAHNDGWGWQFDGASNLEELQTHLRSTIMIRRLKSQVLKELPAKRRQIIEVAAEGVFAERVKQEKLLESKIKEKVKNLSTKAEEDKSDEAKYKQAVKKLNEFQLVAFDEMAKIRHDTAIVKLPAVVTHCKDLLQSEDKLVIFAHHLDVIHELEKSLQEYNPVVLTGENTPEERQNSVDMFQSKKETRVFIGGFMAAGVGITLTAASIAVFAELDWVPGNITQAEDRLHRIGQLDSVLIQHLVIDGSIDSKLAKTLVEKQEIIEKALDKDITIKEKEHERS